MLVAAATFLCLALAADPDPRPRSEQPFIGVSVRDSPDGPVVSWVRPGPFQGQGATSPRRGDNVVSIDGAPVQSAADFAAAIARLRPGATIVLRVRRSPQADPNAAVPRGGAGGSELDLSVQVSDRDTWTGTIGRGLRTGAAIDEPAEGAFEKVILAKAEAAGIRADAPGEPGGRLDSLLAYLAKVQNDALDTNSLPAIVNAFRRPLSLDAVERQNSDFFSALGLGPADRPTVVDDALVLAFRMLDAGPTRPEAAAAQTTEEWMQERAESRDAAASLVRHLRDNISVGGPKAREQIAVIRSAAELFQHSAAWGPRWTPDIIRRLEFEIGQEAQRITPSPPPTDLAQWVKGDILGTATLDGFGVVVGGPGPNRYDMSHIDIVFDVGGDDTYDYPAPNTNAIQVIIDLAGNDTYSAAADFCGPATAIFGVSIIDDRAGNDTYRSSEQFSIGAGLFGFGILIDRAGDDHYENLGAESGWSTGVGFYGAGIILDLSGSDEYLGEKLCQGIGGPRGFGAIIDASGNDVYRANGPHFGSAYGTPAVWLGMSQGFGIGIREYAAGGVGAIYDLAGDDRYEAGEFSQAGAYYFGLGILHDFGGNDLYHGNRYGQAFAAHQAAGILIDDAGDDTYWSMTAASQAGAWDQSITMLIDRAGNDTYRCDSLGQGSAAQQALAILIDLDGADHYTGRGNVQGEGSSNDYHYDADKIFSFSAMLDLGGKQDFYSTGRENGKTLKLGNFNKDKPADSNLFGLFVDE